MMADRGKAQEGGGAGETEREDSVGLCLPPSLTHPTQVLHSLSPSCSPLASSLSSQR